MPEYLIVGDRDSQVILSTHDLGELERTKQMLEKASAEFSLFVELDSQPEATPDNVAMAVHMSTGGSAATYVPLHMQQTNVRWKYETVARHLKEIMKAKQ